MHVTRNVILDLVPAYLAGEASADTRALVDTYLAGDAELARWLADQRQTFDQLASDEPIADMGMRTLLRARRRLALQRWAFGLGCFVGALLLSFEFATRNGRVVEYHFLARDHPLVAALCFAALVLCWTAYAALRRNRL